MKTSPQITYQPACPDAEALRGSHPLVERFRNVRAAVLGDAMLDAYTQGSVNRFCPEGPVPVYEMRSTRLYEGGAANTAANVAALGAQVTLLSVLGKDEEANRLLQLQRKHRVDTSYVIRARDRRTLAKHRLFANDQLLMRVDQGTTCVLSPDQEQTLLSHLNKLLPKIDLILVSDYSYGVLTPRIIERLADRRVGTRLCIDSKRLDQLAIASQQLAMPVPL